MTLEEKFNRLGLSIPHIMIPSNASQFPSWAVIACDQFSSEKEYWKETERIVGDGPSSFQSIIPECYLNDGNLEQRIENVHTAMQDMLQNRILKTLPPGFILLERHTQFSECRHGLVVTLDLESYDFSPKSQSLIRTTENTVKSRLPVRMKLRRQASLDMSHVLILIDDPDNLLFDAAKNISGQKICDFDLMQNGGHLCGYFLEAEKLRPVLDALETLHSARDFILAVGDGNHSLAAAKEVWQENKKAGAPDKHPSRYALVEIINIHDEGVHFHPIHRVLFGTNLDTLMPYLEKKEVPVSVNNVLTILDHENERQFGIKTPSNRLAVEPLQEILDQFIADHPETSIDYIHGSHSVQELVKTQKDRVGIILPPLDKNNFYDRLVKIGNYPRKTFSIGEASEKRYYFETRRLK